MIYVNKKMCLRTAIIMAVLSFLFCFIISFGHDYYDDRSIMADDYKTPWFSENVFRQPYTNIKLAFYTSEFSVVTNACGSQIWVVKEKQVGDKRY